MMDEKFSRYDFELQTSESRVKNICLTITKNRGYFTFKQVDDLFDLKAKLSKLAINITAADLDLFWELIIHISNLYHELVVNTIIF